MPEPTATLYDNHNDNSVNGTLWTSITNGNGTVTEVDSTHLRLLAPGTGADVDRGGVEQKVINGNGFKSTFQFTHNTGSFMLARLGVTDTVGQTTGSWNADFNGNYIKIDITVTAGAAQAAVSSGGYTLQGSASTKNLSQSTEYTLKIYENGDGTILVYIDSDLLATFTGNIISGSLIKYQSGSAGSADRNFDLRVNETSDYADNPLIPSGGGYSFFMSLIGLILVGVSKIQHMTIKYARTLQLQTLNHIF